MVEQQQTPPPTEEEKARRAPAFHMLKGPHKPEFKEALEEQVTPSSQTEPESRVVLDGLSAYYGKTKATKGITLAFADKRVTAIIGPSGCGKSTVLRCINRMHEETKGAWVEGRVLLDGEDIYGRNVDPVAVRRRIGMVFQKPNPFPTMSVVENVVAGLRLNRFFMKKDELEGRAEKALRQAALWNEVKDKLHAAGTALSGGQQQRLCIARALAVDPEVLLMDEPCSSLDPIATLAIEDLIRALSEETPIVIVTHNMQQAARVSDKTAFMLLGELVEFGPTEQIFTTPKDQRTEAYITGRFG